MKLKNERFREMGLFCKSLKSGYLTTVCDKDDLPFSNYFLSEPFFIEHKIDVLNSVNKMFYIVTLRKFYKWAQKKTPSRIYPKCKTILID